MGKDLEFLAVLLWFYPQWREGFSVVRTCMDCYPTTIGKDFFANFLLYFNAAQQEGF